MATYSRVGPGGWQQGDDASAFSRVGPGGWHQGVAVGGASLDLAQTAAVALTGAITASGDIQIGTSFDLAQSAAVALTGSTAVSGDIESLAGTLDLAQTAAVALSGSVGISGDIQIGTSFDLAQSAAVALSGSATVSGDVQIGVGLDLSQTAAVALSGSVAVSGDIESTDTPVVTARQTGAGKSRKSRQRYVLTIDGRDLIVSSPEEAQSLIDEVKSKADAAAQTALDRANASKRRPVGKVLRDARKALVVPSIEAPPEIADYAAKVMRDIRERYEAQLRDIEITALLHKQQQQEEDDEDILLLIA